MGVGTVHPWRSRQSIVRPDQSFCEIGALLKGAIVTTSVSLMWYCLMNLSIFFFFVVYVCCCFDFKRWFYCLRIYTKTTKPTSVQISLKVLKVWGNAVMNMASFKVKQMSWPLPQDDNTGTGRLAQTCEDVRRKHVFPTTSIKKPQKARENEQKAILYGTKPPLTQIRFYKRTSDWRRCKEKSQYRQERMLCLISKEPGRNNPKIRTSKCILSL